MNVVSNWVNTHSLFYPSPVSHLTAHPLIFSSFLLTLQAPCPIHCCSYNREHFDVAGSCIHMLQLRLQFLLSSIHSIDNPDPNWQQHPIPYPNWQQHPIADLTFTLTFSKHLTMTVINAAAVNTPSSKSLSLEMTEPSKDLCQDSNVADRVDKCTLSSNPLGLFIGIMSCSVFTLLFKSLPLVYMLL